jgi:hypothetical protein
VAFRFGRGGDARHRIRLVSVLEPRLCNADNDNPLEEGFWRAGGRTLGSVHTSAK